MEYVIYKIVCNNIEVPYIYVGSTKNFAERIRTHKSVSNGDKYGNKKVYRIINEHGGWNNWSMVTIETCVCESKAEAVKIERRYYDELTENKMNMIRPMRTSEEAKKHSLEYKKKYDIDNKETLKDYHKQYNNDNKTAYKDYHKQYRAANKERMSTRNSEKIHCEVCQCYNNRSNITKHNKTTKHQNNIKKITEHPVKII